MPELIRVRPALSRDIKAIVALEEKVWARLGTPILTEEDLSGWLAENSPYFLVAEREEGICGYYYGRQVNFSLDAVDVFVDPATRDPGGNSNHHHDPEGDSMYGISIASTVPGAGALLSAEIRRIMNEQGARYYVCYTRLSGFDRFVRGLEKQGPLLADLDTLALWYSYETMRLVGCHRWAEATPKPELALAPQRRADPVLGFHVQGTTLGLLRIIPEYMRDPASRNYGAFLASAPPHA